MLVSAGGGAASSPMVATPAEQAAEVGGEARRTLVRAATAEAELRRKGAEIGPGTRATVLCHAVGFDSAMILLESVSKGKGARRAELAENNHSTLEILYFVLEAEDDQVEFELDGRQPTQRLSRGAEVLVPGGASYALRNLSRTTNAKLIAVVPQ